MPVYWRRMFAKLANALSRWRASTDQHPLRRSEDPFESIKKSVSSISDHFKQLETDFGPSEPLVVDPRALPAQKKPRRTAASDTPPTANSTPDAGNPASKRIAKAPPKASQKSTATKSSVSKTAAKKPATKPAPKAATKKKPTAS